MIVIEDEFREQHQHEMAHLERCDQEAEFAAQDELEATNETLTGRRRPTPKRQPTIQGRCAAPHQQIAANRAIIDNGFSCNALQQQQPEPRSTTITAF